jgi:hypothetical protein
MGHKVDTLFTKIPEEFRIFYTKSMRYKDIDTIALYLISCLMLMYGIVSTSQASVTENKVQDEFFGVVETKAIESKAPAFATEATSRLIKRSTDIKKALQLIIWNDMDGFQVAHLPSEELNKIKDLAVYNDMALQETAQIRKKAIRKKVDFSQASTSSFLELFATACLVGVDGRQIRNDTFFTLSSGGFIQGREERRLFAWVFAANGIRMTRSEDKPRTLVLDYIGEY